MNSTHQFCGGCHCGNIEFEMHLTNTANSYNPRACDCDFCRKHAASYISDAKGQLSIVIKNEDLLNRYQQGNELADFLICKNCGVLVGVCAEIQGKTYATINSKTITKSVEFGAEIIASPKKLDAQTKTQRWEDIWFSDISLENKNRM